MKILCSILGHKYISFETHPPQPPGITFAAPPGGIQIVTQTEELGEIRMETKICSRCMRGIWEVVDSNKHRKVYLKDLKKSLQLVLEHEEILTANTTPKHKLFKIGAKKMNDYDLTAVRYQLYLENKRRFLENELKDKRAKN